MARFEPRADDRPLACSVIPYGPGLNFGFRIQAGYIVKVPMAQFTGPGHWWMIVARLTPDGGDAKPVFLAMRTRLPEIPKTKAYAEIPGSYLLGEGSYDVRWMMLDDQGRVCRKSWRIDALLKGSERHARVSMRPFSVAAFSLLGAPGEMAAHDDRPPFRVTILMHAGPLSPRRTRLRAADRMLLIGSLASLMERLPARSVRLVVFNPDQQKELYRGENFTLAEIDRVAQAMNELELGAVDYSVLQNPKGHVDLIAELVNGELQSESPSDAVVFLGPATRFLDKMPRSEMDRPANAPPFFFFEFRPFFRRMVATLPDTIAQTVSRLKGKRLIIRSPGDFAKAIDQLERSAAKTN